MISYMKNYTYNHSAGKNSPLSYCSAIDRESSLPEAKDKVNSNCGLPLSEGGIPEVGLV